MHKFVFVFQNATASLSWSKANRVDFLLLLVVDLVSVVVVSVVVSVVVVVVLVSPLVVVL